MMQVSGSIFKMAADWPKQQVKYAIFDKPK